MKVSIATLYGANNVGAYLQAFSLQEVTKSIVGKNNCSFLRFSGLVARRENKLKKVARYLKKLKVRQLIFKYKTAQKYQQVYNQLCIDTETFSEEKAYDTVIVGSDEVWNYTSQSFTHYDQYFAKRICANNIISYAPSAGNYDATRASADGIDFSGFHHLSVRDEMTRQLVLGATGQDPLIVCDPTLLIESFDPYLEQVSKPNRSNYILVYSYGIRREIVAEIKRFAKKSQTFDQRGHLQFLV